MTKVTKSSSDTLQSLATRLQDVTAKSNLVRTASRIDSHTFRQIRAMEDGTTKNILRDLKEAHEALSNDPLVRYTWYMDRIAELADMPNDIDPVTALSMLMMARAKRLPKTNIETRPILVEFPTMEKATKHADKQTKPIALPEAFVKGEGTGNEQLVQTGLCFIVPNGRAEQEAFTQIRRFRRHVVRRLPAILEAEYLFDLRLASWLALWFFPGARLLSRADFRDKFRWGKDTKDSVRTKKGDGRNYRCFRLTGEENLVMFDSPEAQQLVARLNYLKEAMESFWKDELDTALCLAQILLNQPERVISSREFLDGKPGISLVRHRAWSHREGICDLHVAFHRRSDGMWRAWVFNIDAARALLRSPKGKHLLFTWWTPNSQMPTTIVEFLEKAETIRSPADLDVSDEDLNPVESN